MPKKGWYGHPTEPNLIAEWDGEKWTGATAPKPQPKNGQSMTVSSDSYEESNGSTTPETSRSSSPSGAWVILGAVLLLFGGVFVFTKVSERNAASQLCERGQEFMLASITEAAMRDIPQYDFSYPFGREIREMEKLASDTKDETFIRTTRTMFSTYENSGDAFTSAAREFNERCSSLGFK
jgi:hypothetical protein